MPGYSGLIPMIIVAGVVIGLRFGLARAVRGRLSKRRGRGGSRVFALVPVLIPALMIGAAALAGAFSALDTALGFGLAPVTFSAGIALGWFLRPEAPSAPGAVSRSTDAYTFWIFVALITLRVGVRLTSVSSPHSVMATISADLMLLSVGMAITRLAFVWRSRSKHSLGARASVASERNPSPGSPTAREEMEEAR